MEYQPPQPEIPQSSQPQSTGPTGPKTSMGLDANVAAALSYVCCWVTGLIFFLSEKDNDFVRFHAMQSIILFGACFVLSIGLQILALIIPGGWILSTIIRMGMGLIVLVSWLILVIKAYQGERFHFPIVGEIAENQLKK